MKLPAGMIRAAIAFSSKNDVREYLNGVHVTSKFIEATNGHVAIQMTHGVKRAKSGVYSIKGKIPAKCLDVEFIVTKRLCIARLLDCSGGEIGVRQLHVIDKKFPDFQNKVIKNIMEKPICNDSIPRINACYIGIIDKAFDYPFVSCDMEFRGEDTAVIVKLNGIPNEVFGQPTVIIMPVKKRKQRQATTTI